MKNTSKLIGQTILVTISGLLLAASASAQDVPATCAQPASTTTKTAIDKGAPTKVGVAELMKNKEKLDGKKVVLEGMVTDYCKKKGCWAMLHDVDSDANGMIRVKQDDEQGNFKAFLPEHAGKTVLVTGDLHVTKIDKEYLDKWEARVKAAPKQAVEGEEADHAPDAQLKQIAALREKLAKSGKPALSSMQVAIDKWELKADDKGEPKSNAKSKRS